VDISVTIIWQNTEIQNLENHCDVGGIFFYNFRENSEENLKKADFVFDILSLIASYSLKFYQKLQNFLKM
jgi:hypothetical protein